MIYMFLAEGFEEVEALCPLDLIRRAGLDVQTVGVGSREITGAHGICVRADITEYEFSFADATMLFLPGGMPGTLNLAASQTVTTAIKSAHERELYIAAICAAPSILGDMGLLNGKCAVCYPGFEDRLVGATLGNTKVVLDGKLLTAVGMGAALDMGIKIIEIFCGTDKAESIRHAVLAD